MLSDAGETPLQPNAALAEKPSPTLSHRRVTPVGLRLGFLLYLGSVALIAAVTLGVSLGIGFYLLVHPAEEMPAGSAKDDIASAITPRDDRVAGVASLPGDQAALILAETETPLSAAGPAQGPEAWEAAAPDKGPAPEPVPASSPGKPLATTPGRASPGDELLALSSTASESTIATPGPSEAVPAPAPDGAATKELDQTARPTETAEALDRPVPEEALGSLQAVGRVTAQDFMAEANTQPVRSELPNETSPQTPWNAVEPDEIAGIPRSPSEGRTSEPSSPASSEPRSSAVIRGIVSDVPNVATWVVLGRTVRLLGIAPGPPNLLASLVNWVRAKGPVECLPQARTGRYRCFTATGEDIAEAALLAGVARAGDRATDVYRNAESDARQKGKGLWAGR